MTGRGRTPGERVQKILANAGVGSRREIEHWITEGRVRINDRTARLGDRVAGNDRVYVDRKRVDLESLTPSRRLVVAYFKPEGEIVSRTDPQGRPTVFQRVPALRTGRWVSVGRLDVNTSGLLLLTNDGQLANRLMHPRTAIEREYAVRILGEVKDESLEALRSGVELDDGTARFDDIVDAGGSGVNHWYHVVIREGRHREVRRMWESVGTRVSRLIRVRFGGVLLGGRLRAGHWRYLSDQEVAALCELAGMQKSPGWQRPIDERPVGPRKAAASADGGKGGRTKRPARRRSGR